MDVQAHLDYDEDRGTQITVPPDGVDELVKLLKDAGFQCSEVRGLQSGEVTSLSIIEFQEQPKKDDIDRLEDVIKQFNSSLR